MDEDRIINYSKASGNTSNSRPPPTTGFPQNPWHSTPVKRNVQTTKTTDISPIKKENGALRQATAGGEMDKAIIQRQRTELQLLIAELKDREQELNAMADGHHKQLQAWEQDRLRVLTLEQRCAWLEGELQKRNEMIRAVSRRLKSVDAREKAGQRDLSSAQQQLHDLSQRQQHASRQHQDLQEKTQSLNTTILELSSQVGQLQVREEELSSMLKLKDKDVTEATDHILELSGRLRELESGLKESCKQESKLLRKTEELKQRYKESKHDQAQLKDELQQKTIENNSQREELIRLKQENHLLRKDLELAGQGESWKDELLVLVKSKQERTDSELHGLRQVCENQQNDLELLRLNLESAREALKQYEGQGSHESSADLSCLDLDCTSASPDPGTAPAPGIANVDFGVHPTAAKNQSSYISAEHSSSMSRLQRLLAESQHMVASLERCSVKPASPTLSPTCQSVCSLSSDEPRPEPRPGSTLDQRGSKPS